MQKKNKGKKIHEFVFNWVFIVKLIETISPFTTTFVKSLHSPNEIGPQRYFWRFVVQVKKSNGIFRQQFVVKSEIYWDFLKTVKKGKIIELILLSRAEPPT